MKTPSAVLLTLVLTFVSARAESGWTSLASQKAVFPGGASESKTVVVPFAVPPGAGTLRLTVTQRPYAPFAKGYGHPGVGTVVQWGRGAQEPKSFVGDFTEVCALASRPGGSSTPNPAVQGQEHTATSFRHNDSGAPCRDLWVAIFPTVRSVNGAVAQQLPSTVVVAIDYQADGAPSPGPAAASGIVGRWKWVAGQTIVFQANGTGVWYRDAAQINEGTWELIDPAARRYRFVLKQGGWVDTVVLSADGNALDGVNNQGSSLHGTRLH